MSDQYEDVENRMWNDVGFNPVPDAYPGGAFKRMNNARFGFYLRGMADPNMVVVEFVDFDLQVHGALVVSKHGWMDTLKTRQPVDMCILGQLNGSVMPNWITFEKCARFVRDFQTTEEWKTKRRQQWSLLRKKQTNDNATKGKVMQSTNEAITLIQLNNGATIVSAHYVDARPNTGAITGTLYHFKNVTGIKLAKGDLLVVQTLESYALVMVDNPSVRANACPCALSELKHVVTKVDQDHFEHVLERENDASHALALSEVSEKLSAFQKHVGEENFGRVQQLLNIPQKSSETDTLIEDTLGGQG